MCEAASGASSVMGGRAAMRRNACEGGLNVLTTDYDDYERIFVPDGTCA